MSDKHLARRAETQVVLNGVDISVYVNKDWLSFTYTLRRGPGQDPSAGDVLPPAPSCGEGGPRRPVSRGAGGPILRRAGGQHKDINVFRFEFLGQRGYR